MGSLYLGSTPHPATVANEGFPKLKMSCHPDARWNAGKGATPNLSPMIAFGVLWDHALDLEMESVGPKHHFQSGDFGTFFGTVSN